MLSRHREAVKAVLFTALWLMASCSDARQDEVKTAASDMPLGRSPNLLASLSIPQAEIKTRLEADYQQLFHGRTQDQRVFFPAGKNDNGLLAYILDVNSADVRSEGMSYGMMI